MADRQDALTALAPMLRVRPELQDFCRFGGGWRTVHPHAGTGWAAFHIVTQGACLVERSGEPPVRLEAGDLLLLPHGDDHVLYGEGNDHGDLRDIVTTYRDHIRVRRTTGGDTETELICGRLHFDSTSENLLLRTLPRAILLRLSGHRNHAVLVAMLRSELEEGQPGAVAIASDLASALFVMLLRQHFAAEPPVDGLLALLAARETGRAVAAMVAEPVRDWELDELAALAIVSRATLVRAFRKLSGMPPQAFLTEIRLGIARSRVLHGSDTLAGIAAEVGYTSEASLSRAFFKRFAIRPGAMRRMGSKRSGDRKVERRVSSD